MSSCLHVFEKPNVEAVPFLLCCGCDDAVAVEHELVVLTFSPSSCSATFLNLLERIVTANHSTWS